MKLFLIFFDKDIQGFREKNKYYQIGTLIKACQEKIHELEESG